MDLAAIEKAYARWAPHYDMSFGVVSDVGRRAAVQHLNKLPAGSRVLEAGVGTGLALQRYAPHLHVSGIDVSQPMLKRAAQRAHKAKAQVELHEMDAGALQFADNTFDAATAMFIMSVVPDPAAVLRELERVVKPNGDILIVNHFAAEQGMRAVVEKLTAPVCRFIGWHSDFSLQTVLGNTTLPLQKHDALAPFGLFSLLHFKKPALIAANSSYTPAVPQYAD
jgi:phosphatidylethanolamine/phosphatidyl-N-methylethanolamine N-methyltransferase